LHVDQAEELAPELKRAQILTGFNEKTGEPIMKQKKNRITLRMLLSHTGQYLKRIQNISLLIIFLAGFGYAFFNPEIRKFGLPAGIDEFSGRIEDVDTPLLFEPGTQWNYGVRKHNCYYISFMLTILQTNIDWAGVLVERVSGLSLDDYFQKYIFLPLGIKNISMFPSTEMKAKLAHMHSRDSSGNITTREHLQRRPLYANLDKKDIFNSAGAGCFAQPSEYAKIIATLLNDGTSPTTGAKILESKTVDAMFANQIPEMPDFARQGIKAAIPELTNPIGELYPQGNEPQGWGLTFMLTIAEGATGRGRNTGWWAGLPNLFWWADREKGVGGIVASQIIPFGGASSMLESTNLEIC